MEFLSYTPEYRKDWDEFVLAAKNGTFHQTRDFIGYHGDRFEDASLMVMDNGKCLACIPAAKVGTTFFAHPGLTYAGIIVSEQIYLTQYLDLFRELVLHLSESGYEELIIKDLPPSYSPVPAGELEYAMLLAGAQIRSFDVLPHLYPEQVIPYQKRRERAVKKAQNAGIKVNLSEDLSAYWGIIEEVLSRYGASPVHSLEEITRLKALFPENIYLLCAHQDGNMSAGILAFDTGRVVRAQYIAASDEGRQTGALDLVIDRLIHETRQAGKILEFGTTTNERGLALNPGLSDQKEGFGARTLVHLSYSLDLAKFKVERFPQAR